MIKIHPTAIIELGAQIHNSVTIGPFAIIGKDVKIGKGTSIGPNTIIDGDTTIGENNRIFQSVSIGLVPQDLKFHGEKTVTIIGNNNTIREFVSIHRGTEASGKTVIGDNNLFMVYSHVAHDCIVGNNCVFANSVALAGHVEIGNFVIVGGLCGILQFSKVGDHVMVGSGSIVSQDIVPYALAEGNRTELHGINIVGLKRRGFTDRQIKEIRDAQYILFRSNSRLSDAVKLLQEKYPSVDHIQNIVNFINSSEKGICR
ncbi:MAG: acyl-ACP--UDP-N-acetylglucosamine O-acyltransferase [Fusobacteria bacterium]|nr:acyl-ACP--UDP-N-acetylglucosamine O-acyltransferase [Fusobacteriota bacterium]